VVTKLTVGRFPAEARRMYMMYVFDSDNKGLISVCPSFLLPSKVYCAVKHTCSILLSTTEPDNAKMSLNLAPCEIVRYKSAIFSHASARR
jgi:hypothetical protein